MLALAGCPADVGELRAALKVECVPSGERAPEGAWVCPEPRTVECNLGPGAEPQTLFVEQSEAVSCEDNSFGVQSDGGLTLGRHTVEVTDDSGAVVCSAELTVRDTVAPSLAARTLALWPPNHKFHSIAVADCMSVRDACDATSVRAEFIWASSDEPVDSIGDGHHDPDIKLDDCGHVSLRAERQGPENGRVYRLGVRAIDAAGNQTESECKVIVAHDQSGKQRSGAGEAVSAASGKKRNDAAEGSAQAPSDRPNVAVASDEAYRLVFDGSDGGASCGQRNEQPGTPDDDSDAGTPDSDPGPDPEPDVDVDAGVESEGPQ